MYVRTYTRTCLHVYVHVRVYTYTYLVQHMFFIVGELIFAGLWSTKEGKPKSQSESNHSFVELTKHIQPYKTPAASKNDHITL